MTGNESEKLKRLGELENELKKVRWKQELTQDYATMLNRKELELIKDMEKIKKTLKCCQEDPHEPEKAEKKGETAGSDIAQPAKVEVSDPVTRP